MYFHFNGMGKIDLSCKCKYEGAADLFPAYVVMDPVDQIAFIGKTITVSLRMTAFPDQLIYRQKNNNNSKRAANIAVKLWRNYFA